ncbi:cohesin domain-containing protein [Candidatus Latescibacterota bacterium]
MKDIFNLRVYPSNLEIEEGAEDYLLIWVDHADGLMAARFTMTYDPSYIEVTSVSNDGYGFMMEEAGAEIFEIEKKVDSEKGLIVIGIGAQKEGFTGVIGSGLLAEIKIRALKTGVSSLKFVNENPDDVITVFYSSTSSKGWNEKPVETFDSVISIVEDIEAPVVDATVEDDKTTE